MVLKKVELPEHHFYPNKEQLENLLTKEINKEELSEQEQVNKDLWKSQGMNNFTKNDYYAVIRSLEKYDRYDIT